MFLSWLHCIFGLLNLRQATSKQTFLLHFFESFILLIRDLCDICFTETPCLFPSISSTGLSNYGSCVCLYFLQHTCFLMGLLYIKYEDTFVRVRAQERPTNSVAILEMSKKSNLRRDASAIYLVRGAIHREREWYFLKVRGTEAPLSGARLDTFGCAKHLLKYGWRPARTGRKVCMFTSSGGSHVCREETEMFV